METNIKTILVIGGAGYIGSYTNKLLNEQGYNTIVLDNLSTGRRDHVKWGKFIEGDAEDKLQLALIFRSEKIDAVFYMAGSQNEFITGNGNTGEIHQKALNEVLSQMVKYNVKNIVFGSCQSVYGDPAENLISEEHRLLPFSDYGKSKLQMERTLKWFSKACDINYAIMRYFTVAGSTESAGIGEKRKPESNFIPLLMEHIYNDRGAFPVFGNDLSSPPSTLIRDLIHVQDVASANVLALEYLQKNSVSEIYNICNSIGFSNAMILTTFEKITGKKIETLIHKGTVDGFKSVIGNNKKAKDYLNWTPTITDQAQILESAWNWRTGITDSENRKAA